MAADVSLLRQWNLIRTLCSRRSGVSVKELAADAEVSVKTVRRDLRFLDQLGFPLASEVGDYGRKRWRIELPAGRLPLSFTFDEVLALYLGRRSMEAWAGTFISQSAERAFRKIRSALSSAVIQYLDKMSAAFAETAFGIGDYSEHAEVIDQLMIGIEEQRVVFIKYRSQQSTEPVTYDVHPLRITRHRGSLYLHGFSPQHEELRTWKADRIEDAHVNAMTFQIPDGIDLDAHLAGSLGIYHGHDDVRVRIRFSPEVARYVAESRWHGSQRLTPQPDGSLLVELRLSSLEEVQSWVLSFGAHAEVLEPESLRRQLLAEAEELMGMYEAELKLDV